MKNFLIHFVSFLLSRPLGWMMFHANMRFKGSWYTTKDKVLQRFAVRDGVDVQTLPAMKCWDCDGTGHPSVRDYGMHLGYDKSRTCYKCNGSGEYAPAKYVQLKRWRLGRHVFHQPGESTSYKGKAEQGWGEVANWIEGWIIHKPTPRQHVLAYWCRVALELMVNPRWMLRIMAVHYPRKWRTELLRWTWQLRGRLGWLTEDERMPF